VLLASVLIVLESLLLADYAVSFSFKRAEDSFDLFLDFGDLHAVLYLVEDVDELFEDVPVASGESAYLLQESKSYLIVLLYEHLVLTLGTGIVLCGARSGGCVVVALASVVLFVCVVP
jgi:hypothetical protein